MFTCDVCTSPLTGNNIIRTYPCPDGITKNDIVSSVINIANIDDEIRRISNIYKILISIDITYPPNFSLLFSESNGDIIVICHSCIHKYQVFPILGRIRHMDDVTTNHVDECENDIHMSSSSSSLSAPVENSQSEPSHPVDQIPHRIFTVGSLNESLWKKTVLTSGLESKMWSDCVKRGLINIVDFEAIKEESDSTVSYPSELCPLAIDKLKLEGTPITIENIEIKMKTLRFIAAEERYNEMMYYVLKERLQELKKGLVMTKGSGAIALNPFVEEVVKIELTTTEYTVIVDKLFDCLLNYYMTSSSFPAWRAAFAGMWTATNPLLHNRIAEKTLRYLTWNAHRKPIFTLMMKTVDLLSLYSHDDMSGEPKEEEQIYYHNYKVIKKITEMKDLESTLKSVDHPEKTPKKVTKKKHLKPFVIADRSNDGRVVPRTPVPNSPSPMLPSSPIASRIHPVIIDSDLVKKVLFPEGEYDDKHCALPISTQW